MHHVGLKQVRNSEESQLLGVNQDARMRTVPKVCGPEPRTLGDS